MGERTPFPFWQFANKGKFMSGINEHYSMATLNFHPAPCMDKFQPTLKRRIIRREREGRGESRQVNNMVRPCSHPIKHLSLSHLPCHLGGFNQGPLSPAGGGPLRVPPSHPAGKGHHFSSQSSFFRKEWSATVSGIRIKRGPLSVPFSQEGESERRV